MKKCFVRILLAFLVSAMFSLPLFSVDAKVTYVKGKVEVSHNGGDWILLKTGDTVSQSDVINTGFQSEARINMNGSIMAVPALTRVTLETLSSSGTQDTVGLYVNTGAVRSKVTHAEGKRIEYTARTPVGVASVRGTDFTIFANGKAKVLAGAIAYYKASEFIMPDYTAEEDDTESSATADVSGSAEAPDTTGAADEGPAKATTAASDIVDNAPRGARVIGAGQSSMISGSGIASKPVVEAKKRANKVKSTVASASTKAAMEASIGASSAAVNDSGTTQTVPTSAGLSVLVDFSEAFKD